jgi:HlyD family secretion protein
LLKIIHHSFILFWYYAKIIQYGHERFDKMSPDNKTESGIKNENTPLPAELDNTLQDDTDGLDPEILAELDSGKPKKKKRRKRWIVVTAVILVLALLIALGTLRRSRRATTETGNYTAYTAQRMDMTVTLSGSGTLQPADSYTITSLISGDILSAPFEEGDIVNKDDLLYTLDSSDVANSIEQAENNLSDSRANYERTQKLLEDLSIRASGTGNIAELNVEVGDTVQAGQAVAVIRNSQTMSLTVQFLASEVQNFYTGQSATVTLGGTYETYTGVVSEISAVDIVLPGRVIVRDVTVDFINPGALSTSDTGSVEIGGLQPVNNANFTYKYEGTVTAKTSGEVSSIKVSEGSLVSKNQIIIQLQSDTLEQQLDSAASAVEDAELALENQQNKLEDYKIKSPIAGTIIEKEYKQGDTLKAGEVLCTVYDLSYLSLTLKVDELDISQVKEGQTVSITADAAQGKVYEGTVTKVNINGTTTNGVTSYPVNVRINDKEGLLPGMNVDAVITIESLDDVLTVPVSAVTRNNIVLVQTGVQPSEPEGTSNGIPAGFEQREVTVGPSNDEYIVILEGLQEGDVVAIMDDTPSVYNTNPFEPGAGGRREASEAVGADTGEGSSDGIGG